MDTFNIVESNNVRISLSTKNRESVRKLEKFLETLPDIQINDISSKYIWIPVTFNDVFQTICSCLLNKARQDKLSETPAVIRIGGGEDKYVYKFYLSNDEEEDLKSLNIEYWDFEDENLILVKIFKRSTKYQIKFYYSNLYDEVKLIFISKLFDIEKINHGKKYESENYEETISRVVGSIDDNPYIAESYCRFVSALDNFEPKLL